MTKERRRLKLAIQGAVQGVGFRPFVFRLATELELSGWINNTGAGVTIEVEGQAERLREFRRRLETEKPVHSALYSMEVSELDPAGYASFEIRESEGGAKRAVILPDLATCEPCRAELFDPADRRHRYPFINCTNCGPRFSIIEALPYDRPNTTMKRFEMCPACQAEYEDPADRRFHAQPNACPVCGPHVALWDNQGSVVAAREEAIRQACDRVRNGEIVAAKGIGGFLLLVDARNDGAVKRLRRLKDREEKPFALMFPTLAQLEEQCQVPEAEKRLLLSAASPIVLLPRLSTAPSVIARAVAPGNPYLGVMLPYAPLLLLIMSELGFPVVATSGNLKDEPICVDEREALGRLGAMVDCFLVHNRPIVRPIDDSIVRLLAGREAIMRRARGYAPLPLTLSDTGATVLAVGAHLKNTVALAAGPQIVLSQHLGDLETPEALDGFEKAVSALEDMYQASPEMVACDLHPGYESTRYARRLDAPVIAVQHHYAHVLACMAENEVEGPALGVSWDGTGYGLDGTIWGGEFLDVDEASFSRAAHLRTFPLPGGEQAVREPRRSAMGVLFELFGAGAFGMRDLAPVQAFSEADLRLLEGALSRGINSPRTSSAGRLFDAASSLLALRQRNSFEGQAAMELEFACAEVLADDGYSFELCRREAPDKSILIDWGPAINDLIEDIRAGTDPGLMAARFHNGLTEAVVAVAKEIGREKVVLSGGCFQNRYLAERTISRLTQEGFRPYWHQRFPPNDGGISLGQAVAAIRAKGGK